MVGKFVEIVEIGNADIVENVLVARGVHHVKVFQVEQFGLLLCFNSLDKKADYFIELIISHVTRRSEMIREHVEVDHNTSLLRAARS